MASRPLSFSPASASFQPLPRGNKFALPVASLAGLPAVKHLLFPLRPHLLKYLLVNLGLVELREGRFVELPYVLSRADRFGMLLNQLLRKPVKSARHEGSVDDCTAQLPINLRNFNAPYYELLQGRLSPWVVFQFNEFVEETFRAELYWWVRQHVARRGTIKDGVLSFLAYYHASEQDVAYETLRKDVQRNANLPAVKKKKSGAGRGNFSMNLSQKSGPVSQKTGPVSQKTGVLSHKDVLLSVRQELMKLPLPLFESPLFHAAH